ncbi:hypothetical protein A6X21_23125 [Planctopirus hydrillae]|uniref:Uncharacterized protein n=1 Tax=Planctopirus hydrillae TaxID=1841610 RepID=A0A1C3ED14_9PLAN|nr:hypothetical protein A6X21_23125 [Planctopirus hydrillae]
METLENSIFQYIDKLTWRDRMNWIHNFTDDPADHCCLMIDSSDNITTYTCDLLNPNFVFESLSDDA